LHDSAIAIKRVYYDSFALNSAAEYITLSDHDDEGRIRDLIRWQKHSMLNGFWASL
jgi:hypothetical protein